MKESQTLLNYTLNGKLNYLKGVIYTSIYFTLRNYDILVQDRYLYILGNKITE